MKKVLLYLLLFVYSVNLVKPVFPYVKDSVAHIFWYAQHAATVHFENGKYHMHAEAVKETQKTNIPTTIPHGKTANDFTEHINTALSYQYNIEPYLHTFHPTPNSFLFSCFIDKDFLPPRA